MDRTGELSGSYYMHGLNMTFHNALAIDDSVETRNMLVASERKENLLHGTHLRRGRRKRLHECKSYNVVSCSMKNEIAFVFFLSSFTFFLFLVRSSRRTGCSGTATISSTPAKAGATARCPSPRSKRWPPRHRPCRRAAARSVGRGARTTAARPRSWASHSRRPPWAARAGGCRHVRPSAGPARLTPCTSPRLASSTRWLRPRVKAKVKKRKEEEEKKNEGTSERGKREKHMSSQLLINFLRQTVCT